jgi:hemerythrin-like domain-containing protein
VSTHTIPALHPRTGDDPRVDLQLYRMAHRSMQKGAHELAALAAALGPGGRPLTRERARALRTYVRAFTAIIRHHHENEDDIGWLVISGSAGVAVSLDGLSSEHEELDPILMALDGAARRLADRPSDSAALAALAAESMHLRDLLDHHIGVEERDVFPVIAEYVSVADFAYWEKVSIDGLPKRQLWWFVPWVFDAVPADERAEVQGKIPVALRVAERVFRGPYRRHYRRVFG